MNLSKSILILLGFLLSIQLSAQQNNIRFKRITINEGLSLSSVYCIFQDSKGFMWFGTEDGLNRYDGKNFIIYRSNPEDENTISHKWTEQILEDSSGKLWFGSRGGLTQFDPVTEKFIRFKGVGKNKILVNDTITKIFEDSNKNLWIGTLKGINCLNLTDLSNKKLTDSHLINSKINCFLETKNKDILIGTNHGLYTFDSKNYKCINKQLNNRNSAINSIIKFKDRLLIATNSGIYTLNAQMKIIKHELTDVIIENIIVDSQSTIWLVTDKALLKKEKISNKYQKAVKSFESTNSLSVNTYKPIIKSKSGDIWFGTFGSGLYRFNSELGQKYHYSNNTANPQSLSENSINCIYEDHNGVIWFGTFGAGISFYDPQSHKFTLLKHNPLNENSLIANFIWAICEDNENNLWIGTNNKGISKLNIDKNTFNHFDFRLSEKQNHTAIRKVYEDSKHLIWIGTDGDGLIRYNPKTKRRKVFQHEPGNKQSISSNSVRVIFEDSEEFLWIGTQNGLNLFDSKTKKFTQFKHSSKNSNSISNNFVYSLIFEDSQGIIWIGTYGGGLNAYNKTTGEFKNYQFSGDKPNTISDNVAFAMIEEKEGIFWIGTNNKLNRFDSKTGTFKHFGTEEGLPNNVIYGVIKDNKRNIWLSTNKGICKFSLKDYSCKNFDIHDGLQSNEFNGGAFHKGKNGKLYFGGVYGLNIIDPDKKFTEDALYNVVLTKLEIHGHTVKVSADAADSDMIIYRKETDDYVLSKSVAFANKIEMDYKHRFLSIEFSSLSNYSPEKVNYAYRLKNLEKKWIFSDKRNFASYSNLSPGTYIFQVIAQNPNGKWSKNIKELTIHILPPLHLTWWFIFIEIIVAIIFFVFIYRYLLNCKTNKLLSLQNEKIKITNQNLKKSEQNLKELVATKDKFFRIISHDLKNPFTSLLSISEMIHKNYELVDDEEKQIGIRKIHESVKHIFSLLENLLTWSRSQTGKIQFEAKVFNILELISETVLLYNAAADKKQIKLEINCKPGLCVIADRNMCSAILRNLINNALKFSHAESKIIINVNSGDQYHEIQVIDHGIGIDTENLNKIFRIDLKFKSEGTLGEKGTGLGLLLCKEFVEINGGKINVNSKLGKGSTFSFTLSASKI